ncbi:hypothetical protein ACWT_8058 [Actinoplanes sp. SE50]|uniref:hypothetical protein n=1 Tax=unclassified Actinoplanes TaxID=2626549 RepID=UPI00023EDCB5|nr:MULTISPECIES: hypothetical protein [unclassified Actinoplanes]AEV89067.1 hypothetical protein ACPL_8189 [Actinoplanes sp. SE50/110]ATO87473.1 hypothetical protein ACWT_8058 [Actinoplanes sp. SE50]SLM04891.1 uncharacterized protein ACSP50_8203 [Actinoplanes sp. SE50/110]
MTRILGIELRRSAALGSVLILTAIGVALMFYFEEADWTTGWVQMVMSERLYLALLWPLSLAAGAWQGRRESQSNVAELFASTPRPRAQRAAPTLAVMALAVVTSYLLIALAAGTTLIGRAGYFPAAVPAIAAVGALSMLAGAWFGLAVGRLLPWLITAPALAVAGLGLLLGLPSTSRHRGWLATIFSPIFDMNMPDKYSTVPGRASVSQAIWMITFAVTGALLFAAAGWRTRVAALLPVALGAAVAIAVIPHQDRLIVDSVDPVAKELVCARNEPRVCVSRVHAGLLPELLPQAREALTTLAKLPGTPTRVHEDNSTYVPDVPAPKSPDVALIRIDVNKSGHLDTDLAPRIVAAAFSGRPDCDGSPRQAETLAAAYWLIGRAPAMLADFQDEQDTANAAAEWQRLHALPADKATAQVIAIRAAATRCE